MFGRAQPAGGLAVVALRRRDVSRGAVGRRVDQLVAVAGPSTQNVAKLSKRCQVCKVLLYIFELNIKLHFVFQVSLCFFTCYVFKSDI